MKKNTHKYIWISPLLKTIGIYLFSSIISTIFVFLYVVIYNHFNNNNIIIINDGAWLENGMCFSFIIFLTAIFTIIIIVKICHLPFNRLLNFSNTKIRESFLLILYTIILMSIALAMSYIIAESSKQPEKIFFLDAYRNMNHKIYFWIALLIAAPLYEEFLFRGYLFNIIKKGRFGNIGALLISTILFSALHIRSLYIGILIFCFGLLLGYAKIKTQGIFVPIIMHCLWNSMSIIAIAISSSI